MGGVEVAASRFLLPRPQCLSLGAASLPPTILDFLTRLACVPLPIIPFLSCPPCDAAASSLSAPGLQEGVRNVVREPRPESGQRGIRFIRNALHHPDVCAGESDRVIIDSIRVY